MTDLRLEGRREVYRAVVKSLNATSLSFKKKCEIMDKIDAEIIKLERTMLNRAKQVTCTKRGS